MPIYEYKCLKCGKIFEYTQRITDEPLTHCPPEICEDAEKGKGIVQRIISKNIGFVFNGNGFYLTDYVHKKEKNGHNNGSSSHKGTKVQKSLNSNDTN